MVETRTYIAIRIVHLLDYFNREEFPLQHQRVGLVPALMPQWQGDRCAANVPWTLTLCHLPPPERKGCLSLEDSQMGVDVKVLTCSSVIVLGEGGAYDSRRMDHL